PAHHRPHRARPGARRPHRPAARRGEGGLMDRTYPAHARPLWQRVLLTRESAVIALLVLVTLYAVAAVPNFSSPLTLPYLLLDTAPVLLIALPMTLVIITGQI